MNGHAIKLGMGKAGLKGMGLGDIYRVMKTFIGVYKKKALKLTKKQIFHLEIFRDFMLKILGIISEI